MASAAPNALIEEKYRHAYILFEIDHITISNTTMALLTHVIQRQGNQVPVRSVIVAGTEEHDGIVVTPSTANDVSILVYTHSNVRWINYCWTIYLQLLG